MSSSFEVAELKQFFEIKTDLRAATTQEDVEYHLTELATMQMHTASARIRQACRATMSSYKTPIAASHA
jgi:hypothetical protein